MSKQDSTSSSDSGGAAFVVAGLLFTGGIIPSIAATIWINNLNSQLEAERNKAFQLSLQLNQTQAQLIQLQAEQKGLWQGAAITGRK